MCTIEGEKKTVALRLDTDKIMNLPDDIAAQDALWALRKICITLDEK